MLRLNATVRLLQTDLAIRLYREEHGQLPAQLNQLVPDYLPTMPLDPYTQQPLIYRPIENKFLLYSVGHDRVDNGGRFTDMKTCYSRGIFGNFVRGYDFDLDTITRP